MGEALFWGLIASSSLVVGGLAAMVLPIRQRLLGLVMGFGAGVLISAVAFELVEEALDTDELSTVAVGLFVGSAVFFAGDAVIDRMGGGDRKRSGATHASGTALAIVLGIVLDGIPESIVLGLTILEGGTVGIAVLAAVFLSNLPEAIAATYGLRQSGWTGVRVVALWTGVALVSGLASLAGYAMLGDAPTATVAFVLAFAGGAILTMLADTMMPEAFEHGGGLVGVVTTFGFATAIALSTAT